MPDWGSCSVCCAWRVGWSIWRLAPPMIPATMPERRTRMSTPHPLNQAVIAQALHDVEREIATVDRMLRLGASTELVSRFYGLTHQEVALRRSILGLPKRKGRYPVLGEAQDAALWKQWKASVAERGIALDDDMAMLALTADLAETMGLPMSVIWAAIRNWIDQGLV